MSAGSGGGKVKVVVPVFLARPKIVLKFKLIGTVVGCFFSSKLSLHFKDLCKW